MDVFLDFRDNLLRILMSSSVFWFWLSLLFFLHFDEFEPFLEAALLFIKWSKHFCSSVTGMLSCCALIFNLLFFCMKERRDWPESYFSLVGIINEYSLLGLKFINFPVRKIQTWTTSFVKLYIGVTILEFVIRAYNATSFSSF